MKKINLIGIVLIFSVTSIIAQTGAASGTKWGIGDDSIRCVKYFSLYSEDFKNRNYDDAYDSWLVVLEECPMANVNIYIDGVRLLKFKMDKTSDAEQKRELYESMMQLFEMRIQYFGNDRRTPTPAIKGMKAIEMLDFGNNRSDTEVIKAAYNLLTESVEGMGNNSQPTVVLNFMNIATQMYKQSLISGDNYIQHYSKAMDIIDARLNDATIAENLRTNLEQVKFQSEQWFSETDVATCENLEKIFLPQLEDNINELAWLKRVSSLMARKQCEDSELFFKAAEYQHNIEPSSQSAQGLARMNMKAENFDKALEYFSQAISLSDNNDQIGLFNYYIATIHFSRGNYQQARNFSNRALEVRPNYGAPYILIGRCYALSANSVGNNDFEKGAVYWAAVDKFVRARAVDSSSASEANNYISAYSSHFPSSEEIFMQGFKQGESYTVGGWINERTTVRDK